MNTKLVGGYWALNFFDVSTTGYIIYMMTIVAIWSLREWQEGLGYNASVSAYVGIGGLSYIVLIGAEILKNRPHLSGWLQGLGIHLVGIVIAVVVSYIWWKSARPSFLGDQYFRFVAAVLLYVLVTILPLIYFHGTGMQKNKVICLLAVHVLTFLFDLATGRLDQRPFLTAKGIHLVKAVKDILLQKQ